MSVSLSTVITKKEVTALSSGAVAALAGDLSGIVHGNSQVAFAVATVAVGAVPGVYEFVKAIITNRKTENLKTVIGDAVLALHGVDGTDVKEIEAFGKSILNPALAKATTEATKLVTPAVGAAGAGTLITVAENAAETVAKSEAQTLETDISKDAATTATPAATTGSSTYAATRTQTTPTTTPTA